MRWKLTAFMKLSYTDWLVSFLYQRVLPHARHDGQSIRDKFTERYTVPSAINKPKQKPVASSWTAELEPLKKAI